jgi:hypothetical protein
MSKLPTLVEYVIWIGLIALGVEVLNYFEWLGCPKDAFICGSAGPETWMGFARLVLIVIAAWYPAKIAFHLVSHNHLIRQTFDCKHKKFDLHQSVLRSLVVVVLTVPTIYLLTAKKIWASSDTIFEQDYVWSSPIERKWVNVVAITTWCKPGGRGSWNTGYDLIFRDGGDVDLASNAGPLTERKTAIFAALHGRSFIFDSSAVDEHCLSDFRAMATQRP